MAKTLPKIRHSFEQLKIILPFGPFIRFPEFNGEWVLNEMWNIAPLQRGFDLPSGNVLDGTIPVVYSNGILRYHNDYKCKAPAVITGRSGTIGKFTYLDKGYYWPHNTTLWVTDFCHNNPKFIYYLYQTINISQFATGSGVPTLNRNDVHRHRCYLPKSIDEQRKIAAFLSLIDERISTQHRLIEDLKKLRCAIVEKMFKQSKANGRLGDFIEQVSVRNKNGLYSNVLSVSNKQGFVKQSEQFEDRTVASEDTSNYKIVKRNNFAYNPARINVGSIARLTKFDVGIVSPMYVCFRTKASIIPEYMEAFFTSQQFFYEMMKRLEGSVRLCLSYEGLCNIPVYIPDMNKQIAMGQNISLILSKIGLEIEYLGRLHQQKQYLLRKMFI